MELEIFEKKEDMASAAAEKAAEILKRSIASKGKACFTAATGKTQIEFLEKLVKIPVKWKKIVMFHLDEYIGISVSNPASFRRYLQKRVIDKAHPGKVHLINGDSEPDKECKRLNKLISKKKIDVTFLGLGENGHIAFNEPPADFKTRNPFIIVELDETTRRQQVKGGFFSRLSDVPKKAITMSVRQIMKSKNIICLVSGKSKAKAARDCLEKRISPMHPASILRKHPNAFVFMDKAAALLLKKEVKK